jgi:predicted MFS family arabinose efflux permease
MLAMGLLPFAGNLLLIAFPNFAMMAALRVIQGAALPLFMSVAGAQLAHSRGAGTGIALLYIGVTIGGTVAPPLGTFMADRLGWEVPMAVIGALALIAAGGCCFSLRVRPTDLPGQSVQLLADPAMLVHLLLSALLFATMFLGFSYVALLLGQAGVDGNDRTFALLVFGLGGLGGNWLAGALTRWTLPASGAIALLVAAATAWLAGSPAIGTVGGVMLLIVLLVMLLWGMAHAAGFVFCQVRVMAAAPDAPSFAGSLNISAANIGIAAGSFVGGQAIELGGLSALAPVGGLLALLSVATALWIAISARRRSAACVP